MDEWNTGDVVNIVQLKDIDDEGVGGNIYLSQEVMGVIRKLCEDVKVEWQMLLTGEVIDGHAYVTGYWIPKQEVTGASVKNLDVIDQEVIEERKIIAGIHSHANMNVYFSPTDVEYTNMSLISRNIVVNNKLEFAAITRWDLPTGDVTFLKAKVVVKLKEVDNVEGVDNIDLKFMGFSTEDKKDTFKPKLLDFSKKRNHALTNDFTAEQFNEAMGGYPYEHDC